MTEDEIKQLEHLFLKAQGLSKECYLVLFPFADGVIASIYDKSTGAMVATSTRANLLDALKRLNIEPISPEIKKFERESFMKRLWVKRRIIRDKKGFKIQSKYLSIFGWFNILNEYLEDILYFDTLDKAMDYLDDLNVTEYEVVWKQ